MRSGQRPRFRGSWALAAERAHGFPSDCGPAGRVPSRQALDTVRGLYPDEGLARYEWRKHGTCTGQSPTDYFADVRRAREGVTIPQPLQAPQGDQHWAPLDVARAFSAANPGLRTDAMAVTCRQGLLEEVRLCLSKDSEVLRRLPRGGPRRLPQQWHDGTGPPVTEPVLRRSGGDELPSRFPCGQFCGRVQACAFGAGAHLPHPEAGAASLHRHARGDRDLRSDRPGSVPHRRVARRDRADRPRRGCPPTSPTSLAPYLEAVGPRGADGSLANLSGLPRSGAVDPPARRPAQPLRTPPRRCQTL